MQKNKFVLTKALVNVEKEPERFKIEVSNKKNESKKNAKVRISLDIDEFLKTKLQIHCVSKKSTMTDIIEKLIRDFLEIKC